MPAKLHVNMHIYSKVGFFFFNFFHYMKLKNMKLDTYRTISLMHKKEHVCYDI